MERAGASKSAEVLKGILVGRTRQKANLWYFIIVKKSEFGRRIKIPVCVAIFLAAVALGSALACRAADGNGYSPTLYPSIFWHNNQWETYENGQWVPYRGSANNEVAVQSEPEMAPEPGPETVDTNIYPVPYGWGFIGAPALYPRYHHAREHLRAGHQSHDRVVDSFGRANVGIGRTTIGIGKPNVGIGQTTIGIGKPNVGIGQRNVGIGQTTIGIGKPNVGVGQQNAGLGRPSVGIGQNNTGVGLPNVGIGQPTIGIGQQMSGQPTWGTPRGR